MVTINITRVLIYAQPGMMRDSLCSLLSSFSYIRIVGILRFNNNLPEEINHLQPDIVLMDFTANPQNIKFIQELKSLCSHPKCVAIVHRIQHMRLAYQYGADEVLLRGYTGQQFSAVVQKIFERELLSGFTEDS